MAPLISIENEEMFKQLILMVIGFGAALIGWIVNQLVIKRWESFRSENRAIALERLEKAYQPLYYLTGILFLKLKNSEDTSFIKQQISAILEKYGYLLTEKVENMIIAYLFMKNPALEVLAKDRLDLANEIQTLKHLVFPSYKLYKEYYTKSIFGKIGVFWQAVEYRIFFTIVVVSILALIGYSAFRIPNVFVVLLGIYLVLGAIVYLVRDIKKSKHLQSGIFRIKKVKSAESLKNIKIPEGIDVAIPITQVEVYSNNYIQFKYPANFGPNEVSTKGDVVNAVQLQGKLNGSRQDCTVDIDIRPAKGLSLDKVVAQNSKFFKSISKGSTIIDKEKAIFINYSSVKNVDSRVYFIVKNENIYRIILNYYSFMKRDFLPSFEAIVASIKIK